MTERNQLIPKLIWVVVALVFLRLFCSLFLGNRWEIFAQPEAADYLLKEQTPSVTEPPNEPVVLTEPTTNPPDTLQMPEVPDGEYGFDISDVSYIEIEDPELWAKSADTEINRKWCDYMADIMQTNPDNSPVCIDLQNVFHLD